MTNAQIKVIKSFPELGWAKSNNEYFTYFDNSNWLMVYENGDIHFNGYFPDSIITIEQAYKFYKQYAVLSNFK